MTLRFIRDTRAMSAVPRTTPMGFRFIGDPAMEQGRYEVQETAVFIQHLKNADVFINVGANIGYYACIASQKGKPVIAFEPVAVNIHYLCRNLAANGWDGRAEILPMAVADRVGAVELFGAGAIASIMAGWNQLSRGDCMLVPVTTLDHILGERMNGKRCLILVDVEGAEQRVLNGARILLRSTPKPVWIVEIGLAPLFAGGTEVHPNTLSVFRTFWDNGYEARTADAASTVVTEAAIRAAVASGKPPWSTANYIFLPR